MQNLYLGLDLGTSGCRGIVIDEQGQVVCEARSPYPYPTQGDGAAVEQDTQAWAQALDQVMGAIGRCLQARLAATHRLAGISLDGTSGTVLLADAEGQAVGPALMYNDARARTQAARLRGLAPAESATHGTASGLAKTLWLLEQTLPRGAARLSHQTDWGLCYLGAAPGWSDHNSSLKTGFDPVAGYWPPWVLKLIDPRVSLPQVVAPGTPVGRLSRQRAGQWGLPPETPLLAGTTDSTAAVIATGANQPGDGITSLGSTLVVKVLAPSPVHAPDCGVYSQPFGELWLVGGGSNAGGAVLRHYFSDQELRDLSLHIDPATNSGLNYYPLLAPGERFPVNDPDLLPRLSPRPRSPVLFLHGLLEGLAEIERLAYEKLRSLGCPPLHRVFSVGGGANNTTWQTLRARKLGVPLAAPLHLEAAYGTALLARHGVRVHAPGP